MEVRWVGGGNERRNQRRVRRIYYTGFTGPPDQNMSSIRKKQNKPLIGFFLELIQSLK